MAIPESGIKMAAMRLRSHCPLQNKKARKAALQLAGF
jgi:hypothetical protein